MDRAPQIDGYLSFEGSGQATLRSKYAFIFSKQKRKVNDLSKLRRYAFFTHFLCEYLLLHL